MKKRIALAIILIMTLILGITGCGNSDRVKKVNDFTNFFKSEKQAVDKFESEFNKTQTEFEKESDPAKLAQAFTVVRDNATKSIEEIKNIKAPKELEAYRQKDIEILSKSVEFFNYTIDAMNKQDINLLNGVETKANELEKYTQNIESEQEKLLKQAAKDAGIKVEIKGDDIFFK